MLVEVAVGVRVGVAVGLGGGVAVDVCVGVELGGAVLVGVAVALGVAVGVSVRVLVALLTAACGLFSPESPLRGQRRRLSAPSSPLHLVTQRHAPPSRRQATTSGRSKSCKGARPTRPG